MTTARLKTNQQAAAVGFLAFPLAVLAVFTLVPTVLGLGLSFFRWGGGSDAEFVGFANYAAMLADDRFWPTLRNTLVYVLLSTPPAIVIAFGLAVIVHARWFAGKALVRTLLFMPTIVSVVAIGVVWRWLLDMNGPVNSGLRALGVSQPPDWLGPDLGMWTIIAVTVWRQIGFCLVLYLASMSSVNESLYEAAELDGAGRFQVVRHITWPQVAPMTAFLLVTSVISALQVFDLVYVMTAQQETNGTRVLNLWVYREFERGQLGFASAIGVTIFLLTVVLTAAQLGLFRERKPRARVAGRPAPVAPAHAPSSGARP